MLSRMLSDENDNNIKVSLSQTLSPTIDRHKFLRARHLASLEKCKVQSARWKVKDDMNLSENWRHLVVH